MSEKKVLFSGVKDGDVFEVAGIEFIKFPDQGGMTPAVAKNVLFFSRFGDSNNFARSEILDRLNKEVLPKIEEAIGAENVCEFETDLTTLCGIKEYGTMKSLIGLPTFDFYRANVDLFERYKPDRWWWWLATADSANPHDDPDWVVCVAPSGGIHYVHYYDGFGVRPFCIFKSSIFGSLEK